MKNGVRDKKEAVTIVKTHTKPLYLRDDGICVFYNRGKLYINRDSKTEKEIRMPLHGYKRFFTRIRIAERMLRLVPRGIQLLNSDSFVVAYNGHVFRVDLNDGSLTEEYCIEDGSTPLTMTTVVGIDGFEDGIVFGGYPNNPDKEAVGIYFRNLKSDGKWEKKFEFSRGTINHIHAVIPDRYRKCLIVLTGDTDDASGIWLIKNNFADVECLSGGKQIYRSCIAVPTKDGILYSTDTPLENNGIYFLRKINGEWKETKLSDIDGPGVYGIEKDDRIYIGTTVEPDPRLRKCKKLLTTKIAAGIKENCSHIYEIDGEKIRKVLSLPKDGLPMGLFQFGSIQFPIQDTDVLNCYICGLRGYDGSWIQIKA